MSLLRTVHVFALVGLTAPSGGCGLIQRFTEIHRNVVQGRIDRHPQVMAKTRKERSKLQARSDRIGRQVTVAQREAARNRSAAARMKAASQALKARCQLLGKRTAAARQFAADLRAGRVRPSPGVLILSDADCRFAKARDDEQRRKASFVDRGLRQLGRIPTGTDALRVNDLFRAVASLVAINDALSMMDLSILLAEAPPSTSRDQGKRLAGIAALVLHWEAMRSSLSAQLQLWAPPATRPPPICDLSAAIAQDATSILAASAGERGFGSDAESSTLGLALREVVEISRATCAVVSYLESRGPTADIEVVLRAARDVVVRLVSLASLTALGGRAAASDIVNRRETLAGAVALLRKVNSPGWSAKAYFLALKEKVVAERRPLRPILDACARRPVRR